MRAAAEGDVVTDMSPAEQVVRAELTRTQQEARLAIHRGVALIAAVPVVLVASLITAFAFGAVTGFVAIVAAGIYMLIGGIAGIAVAAGGIADHRRAAHQLRELDATRQLPAARVVSR